MGRQMRGTDTAKFPYRYGNGAAGSLAITTATDAPIDSACTGTIGAYSLAATNASFGTGNIILIHQSTGSGAGQWELNYIASYVAGTITLQAPLQFEYVAGAQVIRVPQYTTITNAAGQTLTAKAWNGTVGGIIVRLANTSITISGTLTAAGKGCRGGIDPGSGSASYQGEGTGGAGAKVSSANGTGGGGVSNQFGLGGANGANGGTNGDSNANYGVAAGSTDLATCEFGGGGSSGSAGSNGRTAGGAGGGIIILIAPTIDVSAATALSVNGVAAASAGAGRAGGGGAGGSVLMQGRVITIGTNKITVAGGAATTGSSDSGSPSGAGGVGRIAARYGVSVSGSTSPTATTSTADNTLNYSYTGAFFQIF